MIYLPYVIVASVFIWIGHGRDSCESSCHHWHSTFQAASARLGTGHRTFPPRDKLM